MSGFVSRFLRMGGADQLLVALSVAIAVLTVLAIAFAALAFVLRLRNIAKERRWTDLEREWEHALLDVLGGDTHSRAILSLVSRGDTLYFMDYLSRFARNLRGSERERVAGIAAPFLPQVVRQLASRAAGIRARAVRTLGLLGLRSYSYHVIAALDDPSPLVAMTAARELSRREQPDYAHAVLVKLRRFREWSPAYLATMLAGIGSGAAPYLRGTLSDVREDPAVRVVAAEALRQLNDLPSADVAAEALQTAADREFTASALRLVAACGSARHAKVVRPFATSHDDIIRAAAIAALGSVGDASDLATIRSALDQGGVWVAWHAARSLMAIGGRGALEAVASSTHARGDIARELLVSGA